MHASGCFGEAFRLCSSHQLFERALKRLRDRVELLGLPFALAAKKPREVALLNANPARKLGPTPSTLLRKSRNPIPQR